MRLSTFRASGAVGGSSTADPITTAFAAFSLLGAVVNWLSSDQLVVRFPVCWVHQWLTPPSVQLTMISEIVFTL